MGFPGVPVAKKLSACRRRKRGRFDLWMGKLPWRRKWHAPPVFLPGESHGQRSLAGCRPGGRRSQTRLSD